jgi:hypothetical protein
MEKLKKLLAQLEITMALAKEISEDGDHHATPVYRHIASAHDVTRRRIAMYEQHDQDQADAQAIAEASHKELDPMSREDIVKLVAQMNAEPHPGGQMVFDPKATKALMIEHIVATGRYKPKAAPAPKPESSNEVYARLMKKTVEELKAVVAEMNKAEDRKGDIVLEANATKQQIALAIMQASGLPALQQPQQS